jgi:hypothetical protein
MNTLYIYFLFVKQAGGFECISKDPVVFVRLTCEYKIFFLHVLLDSGAAEQQL